MNYGNKTKLRCALSGQAAGQGVPGTINFIHTISCDDSIDVDAGIGSVPVHSSIVLSTTGTIAAPQAPTQLFTFTETSVPKLDDPARGLFAGVVSGEIKVTGAVYAAPGLPYGTPGSIDMTFKGKVCY